MGYHLDLPEDAEVAVVTALARRGRRLDGGGWRESEKERMADRQAVYIPV